MQAREFVVEAYLLNVNSRVIASLSGLPLDYIYGVIYKEGLREVRDLMQEDRLREWMQERGLAEGFGAALHGRGSLEEDVRDWLSLARAAAARWRAAGGRGGPGD